MIITIIATHSFLFASVHLAAMAQLRQIGKKNSGMQLHLFSIPETMGERKPYAGQTRSYWNKSYSDSVCILTPGKWADTPLLSCFEKLFFQFDLSVSANLILMQLTWYSIKRPFIQRNWCLNTSENLYLKQTEASEKHDSFQMQKTYTLGSKMIELFHFQRFLSNWKLSKCIKCWRCI